MSVIQKIGDIGRFDHIIGILFKNEFGFFLEKLRFKDRLPLQHRLQKEKFIERNTQPIMLRKVFEELGGAFIKMAQFLSVRPDLIPADYVKEFEKLQDKVKPIPFNEVKKIVETELKKPLSGIFKEFDENPIASASIAQVHKAKLLNGKEVAVKVQRPNIDIIMKRDTDIMLMFADHMEKHNHQIKGINPVLIIEEFKKWTEKESDFEQEASNAEVFKTNFEKDKNIVIPEVFREYSTKKVLTMEFIHGIPLSNVEKIKEKGYDIEKLVTLGFNCVLKQVFIDGFFHADPHPGNIFVIDNNRIALVDFGIVGVFDDIMKDQVASIFCGIIKNDVDLVVNTLISMGMDGKNLSILKVELENKIKLLQGTELKDIIISEVLEDVIGTIQRHGFRIPLEFVLFGKAMMTLEGLALKYDQGFRLTIQSRSFVEKIIKKRKSPKEIFKNIINTTAKIKDFTVSIPEKTNTLLKRMKDTDISLRYIDRDMRSLVIEMDKSSNRVTFGLIITALIIASTIMLSYDQLKIMNISAFSFIGFVLSGLLIVIVVISMLREKRF
jgi:ubiquinone biosynthesis protein